MSEAPLMAVVVVLIAVLVLDKGGKGNKPRALLSRIAVRVVRL